MRRRVPSTPGRAGMVLAALLLVICIAPATAIEVTGAKYMGSIAPGGTDIHEMDIGIAAGEDPTDVTVEVGGFGQTPDAAYSPLSPANDVGPYSARGFITLDKTLVHLEPGTVRTVTATIRLPQDVGKGGRYAIIYIHALPGKGKSFSTAVIVPVFVTVAGTDLAETGSILQVDAGAATVGQPLKITTTFKNTGNYHYYHAINWITLKDPGGGILANVTMAPLIYAIIPGNTIRFTASPGIGSLQPGTYTVVSRVLLEDGRVLDEKTSTFVMQEPYVSPVIEASITLTPGSAGTLTTSGGRYSVIFPQGSVLADVVVTIKPYAREKLPLPPVGSSLGMTSFEITGLTGLLGRDATVRIAYSAEDLAAASGDASRLTLAYWDTVQKAWVILPTQVNTQDMSLTATTNRMGIMTVMVSSPTGPVSPAGTVSPSGSPLPVLPLVAGIVIIVIILGISFLVLRRRR